MGFCFLIMKYIKTLFLLCSSLFFMPFFLKILYAEDNYEIEIQGSTIVDVCKWTERNTIMHFKINRNLEIYWNDLPADERLNLEIKKSYEQKKKSNLEELNINSKRYHYLNCYENLKDQ